MAAAFAAAPILTTVVIGATVVSAAAAGFAAFRSSQAAEAEAEREELAEKSFAIEGVQAQNQIMEDELRALALTNVSAGASGVDPFSGSPQQTKQAITETANRQLRNVRLQSQTRQTGSRIRQRQLSIEGRAALIQGAAGAAAAVGTGGGELRQIG